MDFAAAFPFLTEHERRIQFLLALQLPLILLGAIMLDDGEAAKVMLLGALGYWCMVLFIMVRRNGEATAADKLFICWGFLPMLIIAIVLAGLRL